MTALVNSTEITIMPLHNPDGYVADTRGNANGVDLNRNFAEPAGTHGVLETENVHYRSLALNRHFVISENGHSGALVVNYPWDYTYDLNPDNDALIELSLDFSRTNLPMYNGGFSQGITNGADWYITTGCVQDWSYEMTGCIDLTIEFHDTKWPSDTVLDGLWDDNRQSFMTFIKDAHNGINGVVTGSDTGLPLDAVVTVLGNAKPVATDPAHGDYYKLLATGTYDIIVSADGYISRTFTNVVTNWGTPSVLNAVLDPVAHGDVTGVVTDLGANGLDAQVNFYTNPARQYVTTVTSSALADGAYSAHLVYGEYQVEAVAAGYVTSTQLVTIGAMAAILDFQLGLAEEVVLFGDDFEDGLAKWSGSWGQTDPAAGYLSANSLNDSPNANYADNAQATMAMAEDVDLSGAMSGQVSFWARWEIEDVWDGAFFEVSADGGGTWTPVGTAHTAASSGQGGQIPAGTPVFDANQANWVLNTVDLGPWLNQTALRFRFRLGSDTSLNYSGFFVDDFEILVVREQVATGVRNTPAKMATVDAWPNPFNPRTAIKYSVPRSGAVDLRIYDLQGRLVRTLVQSDVVAGDHSCNWDGTADAGVRVGSGTYFVRLVTRDGESVTKLSLIK